MLDLTDLQKFIGQLKRIAVYRLPIPVWVLLLLAVCFAVVLWPKSWDSPPPDGSPAPDDYLVTRSVDGEIHKIDRRSQIALNAEIALIKGDIKVNANDPLSIDWVEFRLLSDDEAKLAEWVVWYRARNTYGAMEMFKESFFLEETGKEFPRVMLREPID